MKKFPNNTPSLCLFKNLRFVRWRERLFPELWNLFDRFRRLWRFRLFLFLVLRFGGIDDIALRRRGLFRHGDSRTADEVYLNVVAATARAGPLITRPLQQGRSHHQTDECEMADPRNLQIRSQCRISRTRRHRRHLVTLSSLTRGVCERGICFFQLQARLLNSSSAGPKVALSQC